MCSQFLLSSVLWRRAHFLMRSLAVRDSISFEQLPVEIECCVLSLVFRMEVRRVMVPVEHANYYTKEYAYGWHTQRAREGLGVIRAVKISGVLVALAISGLRTTSIEFQPQCSWGDYRSPQLHCVFFARLKFLRIHWTALRLSLAFYAAACSAAPLPPPSTVPGNAPV
jgi:hypothetical protein